MRISLQWLNELLSIEIINLKYLIDKLTLGGFEVEETLELTIDAKKEIILDITATANRADSLSIKGIAKEVAALLNQPYRISEYSNNLFESERLINNYQLKIVNSKYYSIFVAITVENITYINSPKWLKRRLLASGVIPVNNLLDFQNYILLETGYPFQLYDLDKIKLKLNESNFNLTLEISDDNQLFLASDHLNYNLNHNILVIKANKEVLSIAGIIENSDFQYTPETKNILIEGSIFNSQKIRQMSRILGLRTDRSARYEKGLNPSTFSEALVRLLYLLKSSNDNIKYKFHTFSKIKEKNLSNIYLKYERVLEILGPVLNEQNNKIEQLQPLQISNYLNRLNFYSIFNKKNLSWKVEIPVSRIDDINREIDLIEEIGRLHGFNNFITKLPKVNKIGQEDFSYHTRKKLTSSFLSVGFNELIHYSLIKQQSNFKSGIKVINPLLQDCSMLRPTLLSNLLKTVSDNLKQGNPTLEGFEYGHIFSGNILSDYKEIEQVGGIFGGIGIKRNWSDNSKVLSWFEAKGKIEEVFNKLNLSVYWKNSIIQIYENLLHPYRSSKLSLIDGTVIGVFGQVHPILAKKLNIPLELYLFEFNFEIIKNELKSNKLAFYNDYSIYPKIIKDLSFIINTEITYEKIKNLIISSSNEFLTSVELLDEYQGKPIPSNNTSLCIQLTFQSFEKTLLNKDIEEIVTNIKLILEKEFGAIFRV